MAQMLQDAVEAHLRGMQGSGILCAGGDGSSEDTQWQRLSR